VQDWDSLSDDERKLYARMMEVFAGYLEHTDHHIGRILDFLDAIGELDNTLIMVISDNGASAEGGPTGSVNENKFFNFVPDDLKQNLAAIDDIGGPKYFNHYPWGWTHAGNTPFRRWKRETYRGGTTDPFIVHWPKGIKARGQIRNQYAHAIDMVPTVLDALGIEPPKEIRGVTQSPIEGVSFAHTFDEAKAESKHDTQYFEMFGHRSLYHDGWRAVCPFPGPSFKEANAEFGKVEITENLLRDLDVKGWELYHVHGDPTETENLAEKERGKLIEMVALWYAEAGKYHVLPIDSRGQQRFGIDRPQITADRQRYVYLPHTQAIPSNAAPKLINRPFAIHADVEISSEAANGIVMCQGGNDGGFALYLQDGTLHFVHNYVAAEYFRVSSQKKVPRGKITLGAEFEPTGDADIENGKGTPGTMRLYFGDELVGEAEFPYTTPLSYGLGGGLSVGKMHGSPIWSEVKPPFEFTGKIRKVVVDVSGEHMVREEHEMRVAMSVQ
jgi:hypothetical protein